VWSYISTPPIRLHGVVLSQSTAGPDAVVRKKSRTPGGARASDNPARSPALYHCVCATISRSAILLRGLGYGLDDRGFESRQEPGIFPFTTASRPALGPTQSPIQWVPGGLCLGREADNSPPSRAEVENAWCYTSTPPYAFMEWWFGKHRSNFTLPLTK
jgi:hypothetical protein